MSRESKIRIFLGGSFLIALVFGGLAAILGAPMKIAAVIIGMILFAGIVGVKG